MDLENPLLFNYNTKNDDGNKADKWQKRNEIFISNKLPPAVKWWMQNEETEFNNNKNAYQIECHCIWEESWSGKIVDKCVN